MTLHHHHARRFLRWQVADARVAAAITGLLPHRRRKNRQLLEELTREGGPGGPEGDAQWDRAGDLLFKGESLGSQEGAHALQQQQQQQHGRHVGDGDNGLSAEEQQNQNQNQQRLRSNGLAGTSGLEPQGVRAPHSRGLNGAAEGADASHSSPAADRC